MAYCCDVCSEAYNLKLSKIPYLLTCGHSYCEFCILKLWKEDDSVKCPICRVTNFYPAVSEFSFKKNFALIGIID